MATELSVVPVDTSLAEEELKNFNGQHTLSYPPYSSKTVNGKPLFAHARAGNIDSINIPTREVNMYSLECESWKEISSNEVLAGVRSAINSVQGDFRQEASVAQWQKLLDGEDFKFVLAHIHVSCSSGAYMRSLSHEWGKSIGVPALAYRIFRTKVGDFDVSESRYF